MNKKAAYTFLLIAFVLLVIWGIQQFLLPVLPPAINTSVLTLAIIASSAIGFLANLKDVIEVIRWLFSKAEVKVKIDPLQKKRNRAVVLQKMDQFWIQGVLKLNIYQNNWIDLSAQLAAKHAEPNWDVAVNPGLNNTKLRISPDTIGELIEHCNSQLIILGKPGSGKTSTLLLIAEEMLRKARIDETSPIPIVLNLSSWAEQRRPLREWLVNEMVQRYQIPKEVTRDWLGSSELVFLFDGLDEMHPRFQSDCVKALNEFWKSSAAHQGMLCCRDGVYAGLKEKPTLDNQVSIEPLSLGEIRTHLKRLGIDLPGANENLFQQEEMATSLNTPLLLTIFIINQDKGMVNDQAPQDAKANQIFLVKTFVDIALRETTGGVGYSRQNSDHWLRSISKMMMGKEQSLLQIERIQPDWLPNLLQMVYLIFTRWIPGTAVGLALAHFLDDQTWIYSGLAFGILFSILSWVFMLRRKGRDETKRTGIHWLSNHWQVGLWVGIFQFGVLLMVGYLMRYPISLSLGGYTPGEALLRLAINAALSGLIIGLVAGSMSFSTNPKQGLQEDIQPLEDWKVTFPGVTTSIATGMGAGIAFGLLIAILLTLIMVLLEGWAWGTFTAAVEWGISIGFFVGPLVGITHILRTNADVRELPDKTKPNAGIWLSLHNGLLFGLMLGLLSGLMFSLLAWFFGSSGLGASRSLVSYIDRFRGVPLGLVSFFYATFVFGGSAFIRHFILRGLLRFSNVLPADLPGFLEYATNRALMIKSGNQYLFRHRTILDHFTEPEKPHP